MSAISARPSIIILALWASSETTSSTSVIFREENTDIIRSSVTGLHATVKPRSSLTLASAATYMSDISFPAGVRVVPIGVDLVTASPAMASMLVT